MITTDFKISNLTSPEYEMEAEIDSIIVYTSEKISEQYIDGLAPHIFFRQSHALTDCLHVFWSEQETLKESITSNKAKELITLATALQQRPDQEIQCPGGNIKIKFVGYRIVLLSISLEENKQLTRETIVTHINNVVKYYKENRFDILAPSLERLADEISFGTSTHYLQSIENSIVDILDYLSKYQKLQRRMIGKLLEVLNFHSSPSRVHNILHEYLKTILAKIRKSNSSDFLDVYYRRVDACLYLTFELSNKDSIPRVADIFKEALDILIRNKVPVLLLCRGLRHSFLKAIMLANILPDISRVALQTTTDDAKGFLVILRIFVTELRIQECHQSNLHEEIFSLPKNSLIELSKDLRRSVPQKLIIEDKVTRNTLIEEIKHELSLGMYEKRDAKLWISRILLLLYSNLLNMETFKWILSNYYEFGLNRNQRDSLAAVAGYDIPYFISLNMQLIKSGFQKQVLCPSKAKSISEYMKLSLKQWSEQNDRVSGNLRFSDRLVEVLPTVSVIITTYNPNVELLELSLQSIISQSYPAVEVIVIDDCSQQQISEKIETLVTQLRQLHTCPISLIRNSVNLGQYASRNLAISKALGDFVAIQDDDDISHPERLNFQVRPMLTDSELMATHSMHIRISENSRIMIDGEDIGQIEGDAPVSFVWRRQVFQDIGLFIPTKTRGDIEFRTRMKRFYSDASIRALNVPLVLMRGGLGTISASKEYFFNSAISSLRFMMNHIPLDAKSVDSQQIQSCIPYNLL